ncbi:MAG: response regulator, partial [Muribaculaceae bacterium]|nr:response regulator [Muribaculaceae bacterium]
MKKDKILLVEDDSTLSFIIEDSLQREGYEVVTANNGEEGVKVFREDEPDVVVADVMMPRMD